MLQFFPVSYDPVAYAFPLFVLCIGTEWWLMKKKRAPYDVRESAASIGMGIGSLVVNVPMKILGLTAFYWLYQYRLFTLGWTWWAWILVVLADDFTFYWFHRFSHEVRFMWAAHVNHHSSEGYNFATALRQSWTDLIYKYGFWMWMPLVGFEPIMVLMMIEFSLLFQYMTHTELVHKLPRWFEWIFNTPSHHRVHHASNDRYIDRNYAGILMVWDRLFGTFTPEDANDKPRYGITKNIHTYNLFKIAFHEYQNIYHDVRQARSWADKIGYAFYPPGWQPAEPQAEPKRSSP